MFVFSIKADRRKICVILAAVLLVVTAAIVLTKVHNAAPNAEAAGVKYSLSAATNEERVAFLAQFGWKVNAEPTETKDVAIPQKFDDVYDNYNRIQKDQGLDLTPYAGKTCKQWVYTVTNYPQNPDVRATMLIYGNRVIGGDLSTVALDGFMTGFFGEQASNDTLTRSSSAPAASKPAASSKAASSQAASSKTASSKAAASSQAASSKAASSKAASSQSASSKAASSKPAASKSASSKAASAASAQEAKPKASSAIPANAWPTD